MPASTSQRRTKPKVRRNSDVIRGYAWLDTGTMDSLFEAGEFVRTVQRAQGLPIAIVEEIAFENGWITRDELMESADRYGKSPYGQHLKGIADGEIMLVPNQKN